MVATGLVPTSVGGGGEQSHWGRVEGEWHLRHPSSIKCYTPKTAGAIDPLNRA